MWDAGTDAEVATCCLLLNLIGFWLIETELDLFQNPRPPTNAKGENGNTEQALGVLRHTESAIPNNPGLTACQIEADERAL